MIAVGKADVGKRRMCNEDSLFVANQRLGALPNLYIVADGMGGHKAGAVASQLAIRVFCEYIQEHEQLQITTEEDIALLLKRGIIHANYIVHKEAEENESYQGMGTTFSVCTVVNNILYSAHVGDTRIYLINPAQIHQITTDHSLVQEMFDNGYISEDDIKKHPQRHIITRAVGTGEQIKVDTLSCSLEGTEYVLLCSDGLTSMLTDSEIKNVIYKEKQPLDELALTLISEANRKGGEDNISVVIGTRYEVNKECY